MLATARQGLRLAISSKINYAACSIHPKVICDFKKLHTTNSFRSLLSPTKPVEQYGLLRRGVERVFKKSLLKGRLKMNGQVLYEGIVDTVNYEDWFKKLNLIDSFNSWFVVTELHVWMLLVRSMNQAKEGQWLRDFIIETLWFDSEVRVKKLKVGDSKKRTNYMYMLSDQFNAAILGYDEGLLNGDIFLAGAIWRRIFGSQMTDPELLEVIIRHIRNQIQVLEEMPTTDFHAKPKIKWMLLNDKL